MNLPMYDIGRVRETGVWPSRPREDFPGRSEARRLAASEIAFAVAFAQ